MKRREFPRATAASGMAAAGGLAAPRIGCAADNKVLRFVPRSNVARFDPIWTTQVVVRNTALLVWDTLHGTDNTLLPRPQMVEVHDVDALPPAVSGTPGRSLLYHQRFVHVVDRGRS